MIKKTKKVQKIPKGQWKRSQGMPAQLAPLIFYFDDAFSSLFMRVDGGKKAIYHWNISLLIKKQFFLLVINL
jgi:hypothetical protein